MTNWEQRLERAVAAFFKVHAEDPRRIEKGEHFVPWSVLYHERMLSWLNQMEPEAGEALRLAVTSQHIRRWQSPRTDYPEGKLGYKKWRRELAVFHGEQAGEILSGLGYEAEVIQRVKDLLTKKDLETDAETQTLEDVACLVFLENRLTEFAEEHEAPKVAAILSKTWAKMSIRGQEQAKKLVTQLPLDLQTLVRESVS